MNADAIIMLWSGISCIILAIALMIDARQHKHLPRRQWTGFEVVTVAWVFLGGICIAKAADMTTSMDVQMGYGLMVASLGLGLWGIRGRRREQAQA